MVLEVLAEHKLFFHSKKCKFDKQQIKYLEIVIFKNQVKINLIKVTGVCDWPISYNYTNLHIFLSFTNFYWRFINGFLDMAQSIFDLTSSNNIWT